jgi:hypothetical protein
MVEGTQAHRQAPAPLVVPGGYGVVDRARRLLRRDPDHCRGCVVHAVTAHLVGTDSQVLAFFAIHWGEYYDFHAPLPGGQWRAVARFGQHDQVTEWSPSALLEEVRAHYVAHRSEARS